VEERALASTKKNATKYGKTIVFVDESGLSERPVVVRTWAPRGNTPVLQYHFNWKQLSAIAGVTWLNFYFKLYAGTIGSLEVIDFLKHLRRYLSGALLIIWDGLQSHRSKLVKQFVATQHGMIELEFLPAYAPELNPVEYLWGYWKLRELPNFCAKDFSDLSIHAKKALRRMRRRRSTLVRAFWKQAELF
jgi:transposase